MNMWKRVTVTVAVLLATGGVTAVGERFVCPTEDSPSCIWIGPVQGNHRGNIVVNGPEGQR